MTMLPKENMNLSDLCDAISKASLSNFIVIDTETTGVDNQAEILQLSIIDGYGNKLWDKYYKPVHTTSWEQAQAVNKISPEMVAKCNPLILDKERIENLISGYDLIVGYNIPFDIRMCQQNGLSIHKDIFDVMRAFARIYGEYNPKYGSYKWKKLSECASYYGYEEDLNNLHNSICDCLATLFCFERMALSVSDIRATLATASEKIHTTEDLLVLMEAKGLSVEEVYKMVKDYEKE